MATAEGLAADALDSWKTNEADLSSWSAAAKLVLLPQLSSASSERLFSILK